MPRRKLIFKNGGFYHIFNHNVGETNAFEKNLDKSIFLEILDFYRFEKNTLSFSEYRRRDVKSKKRYLSLLYESETKIEILAFCIMDNHYHFLLKQNKTDGVTNFIRLLQNSFAKYYNNKSDRKGALFIAPYKAIELTGERQLMHVLRYIHLNPLTSYALKNIYKLADYQWTSYCDYVSLSKRKYIETSLVKNYFTNIESFVSFHVEQIDYQRKLKKF